MVKVNKGMVMSKWIEITCKIVKVYCVEVEDDQDEDHAFDVVNDHLSFDDNDNNEMVHEYLDTAQKVDRSKRHATDILSI